MIAGSQKCPLHWIERAPPRYRELFHLIICGCDCRLSLYPSLLSRFLGVFFPIQLPEPLLYSDRRSCTCTPMRQPNAGSTFMESTLERQKLEFDVQVKLIAKYLRDPSPKYRLEYAHAAILSKATLDENGRPNEQSLSPEDFELLQLTVECYRMRTKWMAETGQQLPTARDILRLHSQRFYPNGRWRAHANTFGRDAREEL